MSQDLRQVGALGICTPEDLSLGASMPLKKLKMDYLPWRAGPKAVRESFSCSKPKIRCVGMGDLILI